MDWILFIADAQTTLSGLQSQIDATSRQMTATDVGVWILVASFVLNLYVNWRRASGKGESVNVQQPLEVKYAESFANKQELKDLRDDFEKFQGEQRKFNQKMIDDGEKRKDLIIDKLGESIGKVHGRIDKLVENVGVLSGSIEQMNKNRKTS